MLYRCGLVWNIHTGKTNQCTITRWHYNAQELLPYCVKAIGCFTPAVHMIASVLPRHNKSVSCWNILFPLSIRSNGGTLVIVFGKLPYILFVACGLHSFNSGWDVACREVHHFIIRYLDWMCRIAQCVKERLWSPDVMHAPLLPQIALTKQKKYPLEILPAVRWPDLIRPHAINICLCAWEAWMCTITCSYHENSSWAWVGGKSSLRQ